MAQGEGESFAHVIASVDLAAGQGRIKYVLPSRAPTSSTPQTGTEGETFGVSLVLKDAEGAEIGRIHPELRFETCHDENEHRRALIQQDIAVTGALSEIDLEYHGKTLDAFKPSAPPSVDLNISDNMTLGPPLPGTLNKLSFRATKVEPRRGVSYMVQAKADNATQWQTLAVGQPSPDFVIDKNQFPGAASLELRVTQNAGFESRTVDQRTIKLE